MQANIQVDGSISVKGNSFGTGNGAAGGTSLYEYSTKKFACAPQIQVRKECVFLCLILLGVLHLSS